MLRGNRSAGAVCSLRHVTKDHLAHERLYRCSHLVVVVIQTFEIPPAGMPTWTCSRLFRFLLSLVIRLRLSVGRIAITFRARFASLWRSILTFARGGGQSQIRLHANDVPVVDNNPVGERPQISERANVEGEDSGTLAVPPVGLVTRWEDRLSAYQAHTSESSHQFIFNPQPATPQTGSQRYDRRIVG